MAVLPMKRVLIAGLRKNRKQMLELLQRQGVMEIEIRKKSEEEAPDPVFEQIDTTGIRATFEKNITLANQSLQVLDAVVPPTDAGGGLFSGREKMSLTDYETHTKRRDKIMDMVYDIHALAKRRTEIAAEIPKTESQLEALVPWMDFPYPLDFSGTKNTRTFLGTLSGEASEETIRAGIATEAAQVDIISAAPEQTCIAVTCLNKDAEAVEESLRHMGFARPAVSGDVPAKQKEDLSVKLERLQTQDTELKEKIAAYADRRRELCFISDYFRMRSDKYEVIGGMEQTDRVFLIRGYIAARDAAALENLLSARFDCVVEFSDPAEDDEAPVALQNNAYAAPVEGVIASYAMPGKGEIDPTFLASIFYYFLFGMMLSDAAYGLIMVVGVAVVLKKYRDSMEPGMKKTLTMFQYAGIGTIFWGIMFGSYFGDLPAVIIRTFINPSLPADFSLALWCEPAIEPMTVLGVAFIIGIIHIFVGMGALAYTDIKQGKPLDALYDVGFWYLLLVGAIGILLNTDMVGGMFGLHLNLPAALITVFEVLALIGAAGIVLFGGRDSSNWGLRIGKGLYALYGISSYLSDILSYSRLLALGLATGVISSVFNSMAAMVAAPPVIGPILFALIVVVGHVLNLAINALGAYVHTNRLEYVEFFGKFYNGGGRPFAPFTENTKHYRVSE
ncbi:MAG: V-type ATP synthase subunit I [Lachnospiraceae bacterium]|nr:V-type ATP synthase subunit I [Lachnospiraceae bacterium]